MAVEETAIRRLFLSPGEIICASEPTLVTTVLGSCVSVTLWDRDRRVGGLNHFVLPKGGASSRYGDTAMAELLEGVLSLGAHLRSLEAKVESANGVLPTSGEGNYTGTSPASTIFDLQSTYTQILSYVEQDAAFRMFDITVPYDHPTNVANGAGKVKIKTFLCPSNAVYQDDPQGYGQADYMPVAYTDIDPNYGCRCTVTPAGNTCATYRTDGLLTQHYQVLGSTSGVAVTSAVLSNTAVVVKKGGRPILAATDGTSNTIAIIEDVGKLHENFSPFMKASYTAYGGVQPYPTGVASPTGLRNNYRWAEPDIANGVSGPHQDTVNKTARLNNNATPRGGPSSCSWSLNNCGPNDEPFSFHTGGVQAVFGDGHVQFLRDSVSAQTLRALCTAAGGEVLGDF